MTYVQPVNCQGLRIILCVVFDPHAAPNELAALRSTLIASPEVLHSVEVAGSFDFIVEIGVPDVLSYNRWLANVAGLFAKFVSRYEVNFVSNRYVRREKVEHAIWVPCGDGMRRVDCGLIDKCTAAGDYVELHSQGAHWLLHTTMRALAERLPPCEFIQLHRSAIVRCDFIERMIHKGRHWIARLEDGTMERVARSHVTSTLGALRVHSPMHQPTSSKAEPLTETV